MTGTEQALIDTTRIRAQTREDHKLTSRALKQADTDNSIAYKDYQEACHAHSEALEIFEAVVCREES